MVIEVDTTSTVLLRKNVRRNRVIIQNTGTEPALIKVDGDPAIEDYDFVLASDNTDREGNGGNIIIEGIKGEIKAITENNSTSVSVMEAYN